MIELPTEVTGINVLELGSHFDIDMKKGDSIRTQESIPVRTPI
jgi:hypothetical protein